MNSSVVILIMILIIICSSTVLVINKDEKHEKLKDSIINNKELKDNEKILLMLSIDETQLNKNRKLNIIKTILLFCILLILIVSLQEIYPYIKRLNEINSFLNQLVNINS